MRGDGGVAGEGRVVGIPKFHSWGKCSSNTGIDIGISTDTGAVLTFFHFVSTAVLSVLTFCRLY